MSLYHGQLLMNTWVLCGLPSPSWCVLSPISALPLLSFCSHSKYAFNEHWDSGRRGREGFVATQCPAWVSCGSIMGFAFATLCVKTLKKSASSICVYWNLSVLYTYGGDLIWCCETTTGGCGSFQWFTVGLILLQFRRMEKLSLSGLDRGQTGVVAAAALVMISLSYRSKPLARATELWSKQTNPP